MADHAMPMGKRRTEAHRSDWPQEQVLKEEGTVRITGRYTDANRFERALNAVTVVWIFLVVAGWFMPISGAEYAIAILFIFPMIATVAAPIYYFFSWREVDVMFGPETIVVNGKRYDRNAVSEYRAELPRKVIRQMAKHGRVSQARTQEKEVVMQYGERTVPIAHFRPKDSERARALVIRLQTWHEGFDKLRRQPGADERPASPSDGDEFGPAPPIR